MGYGRLNCETNTETPERVPVPVLNQLGRTKKPSKRKRFLLLCFIASSFLMVVSGVTVSYFVRSRNKGSQSEPLKLSQAITLTCGKTLFPNLCTSSLSNFPGALEAGQRDLIHISVNMTRQRVGKAYSSASLMNNLAMDTRVRAAYEDCIELLDDTMDQLYRSMVSVAPPGNQPVNRPRGGSTADIQTWLSASLTNQDTCLEGFSDLSGFVKNQMVNEVKDLSELLSNCLAIFAVSSNNKDFSGVPIQNRRLLGAAESELPESGFPVGKGGFPAWVTGKERRLLQMPAVVIQADIVVSQDGNGTYKTITEAIKAAPESSNRRTIIYVKAGRYEENLKVGRKKTNLMFIGDGKGKTVISAGRSVVGGYTTFRSATFAATGAGFIARDITFENWSGPSMHQAVALRVGADHAVIYRCNVIGYQDTLYVHSQRQFYRECDVYGTVDFVFGNAAVVIQNCSLYARKPLPYQKITITAQNRKDPNQNTGISIHNSRILATSDLENEKWAFPTFLGRPWKLYSRAVYMMCYIGDHVDPAGWLAWNATFALDTLYYGEYMNYGPGGAIGKRVKWPGFRVITSVDEATKFTVGQFIYGSSWLPATGVAFLAGLSV